MTLDEVGGSTPLSFTQVAEAEGLADWRMMFQTLETRFQSTEPHEEPRQRFHLDIRVPPEVAGPRIDAALAAGGTLVSDEGAPAFVVLADRQGNKACITTGRGRD
jgi:4a-hydroxytetrahydrobiopterin dehydratase